MIGIRLVGYANADRQLRGLVVAVSDLRLFWPRVAKLATSWWSRQFDTEGRFAGHPWRALDPRYAAYKASKTTGKGILSWSGGLRQAAAHPSRIQSPRTLVLTIDDEKWGHGPKKIKQAILQYHQEGMGHNPVRALVFGEPLPAQAETELREAAEAYLTDFLRRLG
jgi:hypothetical protein